MADESETREVTFQDFIYMMTSSALVGLGHVPNPVTNKQEANLESVRHTISLLAMIQGKTKGNLTKEEEDLVDAVLHELRMAYVAKLKESPTEPPKPPQAEKPGRIILP
jgi:hypothetical protein